MCHVHYADGRRPGHPAGGVPVHSAGRQYARAAAYTMPIITRMSPVKLPLHADTTQAADIRAQEIALVTSIGCSKYYICYVPGPACRGSAPLYVPPSAIKGEARNVTTQADSGSQKLTWTHLDPAQAHKFIQSQYITQWSRVLRSGGPNHSKSLCVLMFSPFSN
jgi:hypothetical protein